MNDLQPAQVVLALSDNLLLLGRQTQNLSVDVETKVRMNELDKKNTQTKPNYD